MAPCPWPSSCCRAQSAKSDTPALAAAGPPAVSSAVVVARPHPEPPWLCLPTEEMLPFLSAPLGHGLLMKEDLVMLAVLPLGVLATPKRARPLPSGVLKSTAASPVQAAAPPSSSASTAGHHP
jgi:hypothetical protein